MYFLNKMRACDDGFKNSDLCAEPAMPEANVRELTEEIRDGLDEILCRTRAINGFLLGGRIGESGNEKNHTPQCLRDELVYTRRRIDDVLSELRFLEGKLGIQ